MLSAENHCLCITSMFSLCELVILYSLEAENNIVNPMDCRQELLTMSRQVLDRYHRVKV
jgi:hypothetical protein